jgi:hypothetical protein
MATTVRLEIRLKWELLRSVQRTAKNRHQELGLFCREALVVSCGQDMELALLPRGRPRKSKGPRA